MRRLPLLPKLSGGDKVPAPFYKTLVDFLGELAQAVNALSETKLIAHYNSSTAAPTEGYYAVGDFVKNSAPSELGSPGDKYVIEGWMCSVSEPLAFLEKRFLTGN